MNRKHNVGNNSTHLNSASDFIKGLYKNQRNARAWFLRLKMGAKPKIILEVARQVPRLLQFHIFGRPQPKKYDELLKVTQYDSENVATELLWTAVTLRHYSKELTKFFKQRSEFDNAILQGRYAVAGQTLSEIEAEHGVSLWGLGSRFIIEEWSGGFDANARCLSEFHTTPNLDPLMPYVAAFLSMRTETKLSRQNYDRKIDRFLAQFSDTPWLPSVFRHLVGANTQGDDVHMPIALTYLGDSSAIDRAHAVIEYIKRQISLGKQDIVVETEVLELLYKHLECPDIANLWLCLHGSVTHPQSEIDTSIIQTLDSYTGGNYADSAKMAAGLLESNPTIFQLYEILVKSLIFSNKDFICPFDISSPAGQIAAAVDKTHRKGEGHREAIEFLARASQIFYHNPISSGLRALVAKEASPTERLQRENEAKLSSLFLNPLLAKVQKERKAKLKIATALRERLSTSITSEFVFTIIDKTNNEQAVTFPSGVSPSRATYYKAIILMERGDAGSAIPLLESLYSGRLASSANYYPMHEDVMSALYNAYIFASYTKEALCLYVDNFLRNPQMVSMLDAAALRHQIEQDASAGTARNIDVPILYAAITTDPQQLYVVYDNFLTAGGYKFPRDLIRDHTNYDSERLVYFLHKICTRRVMAGSYYFTGTKELEAERLLLCQFLCKVDRKSEVIYSKEIDEITQRNFIRQGIQKVEEGKIYVDAAGIRRSADSLLRESFRRFKELTAAREMSTLRILDLTTLEGLAGSAKAGSGIQRILGEMKAAGVRLAMTASSSHYAPFKDIFLDIRDRFISSSEYGLDSYLSVRIRHGTLEGQIRSKFESLHLITQRDAQTGLYQPNKYWKDLLRGCSSQEQDRVQELLAGLSHDVDDVARNLKDTIVQIRTESRNPNSLFDFTFDDNVLSHLFYAEFALIQSYEDFVERAFEILWDRLQTSLVRVRQYMMHELKEAFVQRLTRLQIDLRSTIRPAGVAILQGNITNCLTAIQNECDRIGRWFTLTGTKYETDATLEQIIAVCVASVNNVNPDVAFSPEISVLEDRSISGRHFLALFDILRTLLDNALRYGTDSANVSIAGSANNSYITLRIRNGISMATREADPVAKLEDRIREIKTRGVTEDIKREGGTGFAKIMKICRFDLDRADVQIAFAYENVDDLTVSIKFNSVGLLS